MPNVVKTIFTGDDRDLDRVADRAKKKIQSFSQATFSSFGATLATPVKKAASEVEAIHKHTARHAAQQQKEIEFAVKERIRSELAAERALDRERRRMATNFANSIRTPTGGGVSAIAAGGAGPLAGIVSFAAVTTALTAGTRALVEYSSKLEQTKVGFNSIIGNSEKAAKHLNDLRNLALSTPLEFQTIAKMSQRLQGAGVQAE